VEAGREARRQELIQSMLSLGTWEQVAGQLNTKPAILRGIVEGLFEVPLATLADAEAYAREVLHYTSAQLRDFASARSAAAPPVSMIRSDREALFAWCCGHTKSEIAALQSIDAPRASSILQRLRRKLRTPTNEGLYLAARNAKVFNKVERQIIIQHRSEYIADLITQLRGCASLQELATQRRTKPENLQSLFESVAEELSLNLPDQTGLQPNLDHWREIFSGVPSNASLIKPRLESTQ
jgi:DNA-binding CsgD family transcriptional regulator